MAFVNVGSRAKSANEHVREWSSRSLRSLVHHTGNFDPGLPAQTYVFSYWIRHIAWALLVQLHIRPYSQTKR